MNPVTDTWLWLVDHWWQIGLAWTAAGAAGALAFSRVIRLGADHPTPPQPLLTSVTAEDADWLRAHNWAD